jgi:hypothetical protein
VFGQPINDRAEVERGRPGPISQGAAVDLYAGAGKDLALSVKRQVVRKLCDQDMRDGPFGLQLTFDQPGRGGRLGAPV